MNFFGNDPFSLHSSSTSLAEDILIKKILLTHDPDGRRLDSELLLCAMENIMCYTATSEVLVSRFNIDAIAENDMSNIEVTGAEESLGQIIHNISNEMLFKNAGEGDLHKRTMILFDLLGNYRWDAKLALILAAFATSYGEFWLIMQLYPHNPLAVSVAMLKRLPNDVSILKPRFKAIGKLVKTMVDLTKCIIKFEALPLRYVKLDDEANSIAKSHIYVAAYWITRSTLACSSQITDLMAMKPEQVHPTSLSTSTSAAAAATPTNAYQETILYNHNVHRSNHSASSVAWSGSLESSARTLAERCVYQHDTSIAGGGYGQNIGYGVGESAIGEMITNLMYNDEMMFFADLYGKASPDMSKFDAWGHFSQIVWKGTEEVGCATVVCPSLGNAGGSNVPFTVCNYSPAGNYDGEYADNVLAPKGAAIYSA